MVVAWMWFLVRTKEGMWAENAKSSLAESGSVAMRECEIGMECSLVEWSSEGWTCMAPGRNICPAGYFSRLVSV